MLIVPRGVASVAIRSLAHAAECLTDRREQEEVLQIFQKIKRETGWKIAFVYKELKEKWGWKDDPSPVMPQHHGSISSNSGMPQPPVLASPASSLHSYGGGSVPHSHSHSQSQYGGGMQQNYQSQPAAPAPAPAAAPSRRPPAGIVNPMYATADFSMPQHPYQNVYVAPITLAQHSTPLYY